MYSYTEYFQSIYLDLLTCQIKHPIRRKKEYIQRASIEQIKIKKESGKRNISDVILSVYRKRNKQDPCDIFKNG
jgi:hypothetical protein